VKHVIHVAAVRGEPTAGYRQLKSIDRCVDNALDQARIINETVQVRSIVFPLLGAGSARGERIPTARILVSAAANYLKANQDHCIHDIYFLARTDVALTALRFALDEVGSTIVDQATKLGR